MQTRRNRRGNEEPVQTRHQMRKCHFPFLTEKTDCFWVGATVGDLRQMVQKEDLRDDIKRIQSHFGVKIPS